MKASPVFHRRIKPHEAHRIFGPNYVCHFKSGSCRFVLRSTGPNTFILVKEHRHPDLVEVHSEYVRQPRGFMGELKGAQDVTQAVTRALEVIRYNRAGVQRIIGMASAPLSV